MPDLGEAYEAQPGLLPDGEYVAIISRSEFKQSKNNPANTYLQLTVDIVGKPDGTKFGIPITVWEILNIKHPTLSTRNIAKKTLGTIIDALGLGTIKNTEVLHNKPMKVKVVVQDGGQYEDKNVIKGWMPLKPKLETKSQEAPVTPNEDFPPAEEEFETPDGGIW